MITESPIHALLITDDQTGLVLNVSPLLALIRATARRHEAEADPRVLNFLLADIARGCNCDRENEVQLLAEANTLLWDLNRLFQDMVVTPPA